MTKETESDAVAALQQLGLSKYEAQVFSALQRIGKGTASEIGEVSDVPRSQVYGTAESLEKRGLVDIQQAKPKQFRAVGLAEARSILQTQLEREQDRAFEALNELQQESIRETETQEDVWRIEGQETITNRMVQLVTDAENRLIFGARDPWLIDNALRESLQEANEAGVDVTITSANPDVCGIFEDMDGISVAALPSDLDEAERSGRVLIVDSDIVLLSVLEPEDNSDVHHEVAIWSDGTGFASVFIGLLKSRLSNSF
ncbi:TrmB family transcriptional regulator [Halomicrococcus sp. NG-SE-24]|uniref:TrmB family transcriptional regulator n=1 Tax=Halomicrococcus sp. NG-SE-24 TaxID=3436928 RepID=UPI003D95FDAF